jgi:hypothetical protein
LQINHGDFFFSSRAFWTFHFNLNLYTNAPKQFAWYVCGMQTAEFFVWVALWLVSWATASVKHRICACISHIFLTRIYPPKLGCSFCTEYCFFGKTTWKKAVLLLMTDPATPVLLYDVKLPVETASVPDCYLASYFTRANILPVYRHILIAWE